MSNRLAACCCRRCSRLLSAPWRTLIRGQNRDFEKRCRRNCSLFAFFWGVPIFPFFPVFFCSPFFFCSPRFFRFIFRKEKRGDTVRETPFNCETQTKVKTWNASCYRALNSSRQPQMFKPGFLELVYRYRYRLNSASTSYWVGLPLLAWRINNYSTATATVFNPPGI